MKVLETAKILTILGLAYSLTGAAPAQIPGVPAVEQGNWIVKLVRFERRGPELADFTFTFEAENRPSGTRSTVVLENETTQLNRLEIIGDRMVVFGTVGGAADVVTVADLIQGDILGKFLCYSPQLSSTTRYAVARAFYPRFSDPPATSDVLVLADLHSEQVATLRPIYPEQNVQSGKTSAWVEGEQERHAIDPAAGFLWGEDDRRLAFIDHTEGETWLIVLDLQDGHTQHVERHRLDVARLLTLSKQDPAYGEVLDRERRGLAVSGMRWSDDSTVTVELDRSRWAGASLYRSSEITVALTRRRNGHDREPPHLRSGDPRERRSQELHPPRAPGRLKAVTT